MINVEDPLPSLAILLLSFVCNLAGTEHFFSICGNTKPKKRNQLSLPTLEKLAIVKLNLLTEAAKNGDWVNQLKHSFALGAPQGPA
jgi:hypothetical protein